jgi:predicted MFS family arabinose efflux permease
VPAFASLHPFQSPESRRLAFLFAVVYFSQGFWYLPNQAITIVLKERFGLSAGEVATFFTWALLPWLLKPLYGLLSDFVPIAGYRRKSYFLGGSALAALGGIVLVLAGSPGYVTLALFFTVMGFGLAFTDVVTDAIMIENGRTLGLTGAFQSVQWAAIYGASIFVGPLGGHFAEHRNLRGAFMVATIFPIVSCVMAFVFVHDERARLDTEALRRTWRAVLDAGRSRSVWMIAAFIFLFTFSPSFGPAFIYYQTDTLKFSQQFIGVLAAVQAVGFVLGAFLYAPLSRRLPLSRIVVAAVAISSVATLAYLAYRGPASALTIDFLFGVLAMMTQLALLDLAARACPPHVEGTFFALLMSVYNAAQQGSQVVGGHLYDRVGFIPLVWISACATAVVLLMVPLLHIGELQARTTVPAEAVS